jgi:hypothetical protein
VAQAGTESANEEYLELGRLYVVYRPKVSAHVYGWVQC